MNLQEIREGVAQVLSGISGVRVLPSIPEALAASGVTALVVAPGEPYVSYSEGAGRVNMNEVRLRLVVIPPQQQGAERMMGEIDDLLSCGATMPRSIRTKLGSDISANGTACAVSTLEAAVRTITINDVSHVVAEVDIKILARC